MPVRNRQVHQIHWFREHEMQVKVEVPDTGFTLPHCVLWVAYSMGMSRQDV